MSVDLPQKMLAAHRAGDDAQVRTLAQDMGVAVVLDTMALQLLALASQETADKRALLQYAALDVLPTDADAVFNLAVTEQEAGLEEKAVLHYTHALRLNPAHLGALNNLSDLLRRLGRFEEAWSGMAAYLEQGGSLAGLEVRIAKIADACGFRQEARNWFSQAIIRHPDCPGTTWEAAMQQLRDEEFQQGWAGYEVRQALYDHQALGIVSYPYPAWNGAALGPLSLLVHKEQGLGDTIMFASCLADLPCHEGALHLAVAPQLVRLFAISFPHAEVWPSTSMAGADDHRSQRWLPAAGTMDRQLPFGSLPYHLRRERFPEPSAYLCAAQGDRNVWSSRLTALMAADPGNLKLGIVITARRDGVTGAGIAEGPARCLPPVLAQGFALPGVTWFGLHDRACATDFALLPRLGVLDMSDWLHDMADTAALISELDLVIAVDTAVAHLAAAMGRKVLLLLRRQADWRWGRSRTDSYWYKDVEIFRQDHEGDWSPVVRRVAARIRELRDKKTKGYAVSEVNS